MRNNLDLKQIEIAPRVGISYKALQDHESGRWPNKKNLERYIAFYGCNRNWFLTGEGVPYPDDFKDLKGRDHVAQERDGLYGRTKYIDVEGQAYSITQHVPPGKEYDEPQAGFKNDQDPFVQAIAGLKEIFDSQDPFVVPALQSNIRAFLVYVRREKQITEQTEEIKRLQEECDDLKKRLSDLEEKFDRQTEEMAEFKRAAAGGE